jgi:hypothetical protein
MARCFVIQPFDKGRFDKRFDDIYAPAISDANLEPYRVDRDHGVEIPIDNIETGIQDSIACLADITTDNPNVWYELGYAIASRKDVVLVCSTERAEKFPFDVQHRRIINYTNESPSDFSKLRSDITARLKAILKRQQELLDVSSLSPLKDTEGLSPHEVTALVSIMGRAEVTGAEVGAHHVIEDMRDAGYTDLAGSLSVENLRRKQMIIVKKGSLINLLSVTEKGADWLVANQDKLKLKV